MAARQSGSATGSLGGRLSGGSRARAALRKVPRLPVLGEFVPVAALGASFGPASDDAASKPSKSALVAQRARLVPAAPPTAGSTAYGTAFPPLGSAAGAVAALSSNPKRGQAIVVRAPVEYRARTRYTWEDVVALGKQLKDGTVTMSQIRNEKDADKYKVPYGSMLKWNRDDPKPTRAADAG